MALKPLRERRMDYVKSTRVDTPEGTMYHVDYAERQGAEKISWIEKATQRDFAIGTSMGGLGFLTMMAITGGTALVAPSMFIITGAAMGAVSDFSRNTKEMNEGADITQPKRFNRDAIKGALGWGVAGRLALLGVAVGLAAMGVPAFGLESVWAGAAAGGANLFGQIGAVAAAIPPALNLGIFALGATFGGVRGSELGYARMAKEYQAAEIKNRRPELGVSVAKDRGLSAEDVGLNVVAPIVSTAITAGVGAQMARMEEQDISNQNMLPKEQAANNIVPFGYNRTTHQNHLSQELERREQGGKAIPIPSKTEAGSFSAAQDARNAAPAEMQLV